MKKTLTINLNKKVFHIDEDAYSLLDNYLQNLRNYFRKEQGLEEIMTDFEGRIEELLSEKLGNGVDVVSVSEVENVIRQIGNPSEFGVESTDEKSDNQYYTGSQRQAYHSSVKKKFYRDPHNKLVGGVCSGIAAYFSWDTTWVRIAMILLFLLSIPIFEVIFMPGWLVILYIALWIVVPAAKTAEQRLEMSGEPITVENIGKKVAEQVNINTSNHNGCLGAFLKICLIILVIIIGFPVLFVLVIMAIVLVAVLSGVSMGIFEGLLPGLGNNFLAVQNPAMAAIGGFLLIGIPSISLIYMIASVIFKWKPLRNSIKIIALIAWIMSIFLLLFSGWKVDWPQLRNWNKNVTAWSWDKIKVKGDGNIIERARSFSGIVNALEIRGDLLIGFDIDSLSGDSSEFTIEGDSNIIDNYLNIERKGSQLVFTLKREYQIEQSKQYKLLLKTSNFEKIDIMEAANLEMVAPNMNRLRVNVTGAGSIKMSDLEMSDLEINCTGASNTTLTGHVAKMELKAIGASEVRAYELTADTIYANAIGASRIKCNPVAFLNADAIGASSIVYKTEPGSKRFRTVGASHVKLE
jgi:phage shock protein PspC (stress-responsive transcriptional regulator)